jgi:predicted small integral membrane protein
MSDNFLQVVILLAQTGCLALLAAWLFTGVRDNLRFPDMNEAVTAEVLGLQRLKVEFPEAHAQIAHRAITSRATQKRLFRLIVGVELVVTALLVLGVVALGLALIGIVPVSAARGVAVLAALGFTSIWGGFLVAGNHFAYWYGHEAAQNTHYQMTLWGLGTMILLALP